MTIPYTASLNVDFHSSLSAAASQFEDLDFSGVTTPQDLESRLNQYGVVLYVENPIDDSFLQREALLGAAVDAAIDDLCTEPPPEFSTFDINNLSCSDPSTAISGEIGDPEINAIVQAAQSIVRQNYGSLEDPTVSDGLSQLENCLVQSNEISSRIVRLNEQSSQIRDTLFALDELSYPYRIIAAFFTKRLEVLDEYLGIFGNLIRKKRNNEDELDRLRQELQDKQTTLRSIPSYEQIRREQLQSEIDSINTRIQEITQEQIEIDNEVQLQKDLAPEFSETFSYQGLTFQEGGLQELLNELFYPEGLTQNVFVNANRFTNRLILAPPPKPDGEPVEFAKSISAKISWSLRDDAGVLSSRTNTFLESDDFIEFVPAVGARPQGILYDVLYNRWGDVEQFFPIEDRGLSANPSQVDPTLAGTGSERSGSNYIANYEQYQDFYQNFATRWAARVETVKAQLVEPHMREITADIAELARQEVLYSLSFGKVYETLPEESEALLSKVDALRLSATNFLSKFNNFNQAVAKVKRKLSENELQIQQEQNGYVNIPCSVREQDPVTDPPPAGTDPLGRTSLLFTNPALPNPTKWCYWVKFSKLITAVNVLPLPGPGGFRYWPIGFLIPSPNGIIRIPLPVAWIPLAVIALPVGIFVAFVAACGACPSPVVFYCGINGEKKFIIAPRPGQQFGHDAADTLIKKLSDGGVAVVKELNEIFDGVAVPGFSVPSNPDDTDETVREIKSKISKLTSKLGLPEIDLLRDLRPNATVEEKRRAAKAAMLNHFDKIKMPGIKIPKNSSRVNPKPTPIADMVDWLRKASKLQLPEIDIPPTETISLRDELIKISSKPSSRPSRIRKPDENNQQDQERFIAESRAEMKSIAADLLKEMTPKRLGILSMATAGLTYFNPYKCRPTMSGRQVPGIPQSVATAIGALRGALDGQIDIISPEVLLSLDGPLVTTDTFVKALRDTLASLPAFRVPNPSKLSIKNMIADSTIKFAAFQQPSIPDPLAGFQPRIEIPGDEIKAAVRRGLERSIDLTMDEVSLADFDVSSVDLNAILSTALLGSFDSLADAVRPYADIINGYRNSKDKTFAERLGFSAPRKTDSVSFVTKSSMDNALNALDSLALIPYPAACLASGTLINAHPILGHDDLPPWERLSLQNFLFVCFLDEWARMGKKQVGFFENP